MSHIQQGCAGLAGHLGATILCWRCSTKGCLQGLKPQIILCMAVALAWSWAGLDLQLAGQKAVLANICWNQASVRHASCDVVMQGPVLSDPGHVACWKRYYLQVSLDAARTAWESAEIGDAFARITVQHGIKCSVDLELYRCEADMLWVDAYSCNRVASAGSDVDGLVHVGYTISCGSDRTVPVCMYAS